MLCDNCKHSEVITEGELYCAPYPYCMMGDVIEFCEEYKIPIEEIMMYKENIEKCDGFEEGVD